MNIRVLLFCVFPLIGISVNAGELRSANRSMSNAEIAYTADQLIRLGNENREPLYIISAAALYRDSVVGNSTKEAQETLQNLVDLAVEMAPRNTLIKTLGEDIVTTKQRNIISSIKVKNGKLAPEEKAVFIAEFEGGVDAVVSLTLNPKQAAQFVQRSKFGMDFFVKDSSNRDICIIQSTSIPYRCKWTPSKQAKFKIELRNSGGVEIPYSLFFE